MPLMILKRGWAFSSSEHEMKLNMYLMTQNIILNKIIHEKYICIKLYIYYVMSINYYIN